MLLIPICDARMNIDGDVSISIEKFPCSSSLQIIMENSKKKQKIKNTAADSL